MVQTTSSTSRVIGAERSIEERWPGFRGLLRNRGIDIHIPLNVNFAERLISLTSQELENFASAAVEVFQFTKPPPGIRHRTVAGDHRTLLQNVDIKRIAKRLISHSPRGCPPPKRQKSSASRTILE